LLAANHSKFDFILKIQMHVFQSEIFLTPKINKKLSKCRTGMEDIGG